MAKKISSNDIFTEQDIFKGIRDSAKQTLSMLSQLRKEVEGTATEMKKGFGKTKLDGISEIKKVVKVTEEANKLKKQAIELDNAKARAEKTLAQSERELLRVEQQRMQNQKTDIQLKAAQQRDQERINKQKQKAVKLAKDESNAYKKLVKETRDLKNESKRLGAEMLRLEAAGKKNTAEYRKLSTQYKNVTRSAKQGDVALKKLDRTVGDNFRNVGNYRQALSGLVGVLGTLGASVGIGQIFRNVTGTIIDFDQAQADLAAISGKTKQELSSLTEQAKELGGSSVFTSTEITNMQIELAKLGFTMDEITNSTEGVANFAAATGADIPAAAKVAGGALRAFNLDASQMDRVVSTLAVATTKSALSFQSFEAGLSTVAPVANAFGFSIEDTTALLGQLANAGFDASSSATATRNILLNLADANGDLAKELGRPIKSADDLAEALQELDERGIDLASALELTDKRSVAAFSTFLKGGDAIKDLKEGITDANAELEEMARKRLDSVQGKITLLGSAWDNWVISMGDSIMASEGLKNMLEFLTNNLTTILSTIGRIIRAFVVYKATLAGLRIAQRLYNTDFKAMGTMMLKQIPMTKAYRLEQIKLARANRDGATATKGASTAVKGFGRAFASIGIFLIIGAVTELAAAWYDVASGAKAAREAEEQLEIQRQIFQNRKDTQLIVQSEAAKKILAQKEKELAAIDTQIRKEKLLLNTQEERNQKDLDGLGRKKVLMFELANQAAADLQNMKDEIAFAEKDLEIEKKKTKTVRRATKVTQGGVAYDFKDFVVSATDANKVANYQGKIAGLNEAFDTQNVLVDELFALMQEYDLQMQEFGQSQAMASKKTKTTTTSIKKLNTEFKDGKPFLSDYKKLLQELTEIEQERDLIKREQAIDDEFNLQLQRVQEGKDFEVDMLNQLVDEKIAIETGYIKQRAEFERAALDEKYEQEAGARLQALEDERDQLLSQEGLTPGAKTQILENFSLKKTELENEEFDRWFDIQLKKEKVTEESENVILELKEEYLQRYNDMVEEGQAAQDQFLIEKTKSTYTQIAEIIKLSADFFVQQSQRKVEQIQKEITAAEKQYEFLKTLAANGNIDAKESLAEQQKIINEANKKKLQEEKRQQRIRMAESVFNTYNSKVQAGSQNALAETISDTSLLLSFINSLPAFESGTEDTGVNGRGVDGRGGFHAVLHPNERVVPKKLNDQIGNLTNEELTKIAVNYRNSQAVEGATQTTSALELAVLVNGMKDLQKTIEEKPVTNIELGEITSSVMEIVKSTKKGNSTIYNRFKIKK